MISEKMVTLGTKKSVIREIFEYSKKRAAEIGSENVFDFSIGNQTCRLRPPFMRPSRSCSIPKTITISSATPPRRAMPIPAPPLQPT